MQNKILTNSKLCKICVKHFEARLNFPLHRYNAPHWSKSWCLCLTMILLKILIINIALFCGIMFCYLCSLKNLMHQSFSFFLSHAEWATTSCTDLPYTCTAGRVHSQQGRTLRHQHTPFCRTHTLQTQTCSLSSQFQTKKWCLNPKSDKSTLFPHLCMWDNSLLCAWLDVYSVVRDTRRPSAHRKLHCPDPKSRDGIKCFVFKGVRS